MKKNQNVVGAMLFFCGCISLQTALLIACNVPVFRYALQRWQPDDYEITVLHHEPLSTEQQEMMDKLQQAASDREVPSNMRVRRLNMQEPLNERDQELISSVEISEGSPWILVEYPAFTRTNRLAYSGPFEGDVVGDLIDSPARRAIVENLERGVSAVWVLIESGDPSQDDATAEVIRQRIEHLEATLELPGSGDGDAVDDLFPPDESELNDDVETSLSLTLVRISKEDPRERVFVSMLLNSESDLYEFDDPIAIPVFGRGRSYFALVGKGINDENIDEACQFLAGACSCEVKSQNPGVDLLFRVNWELLVEDTPTDGVVLPQLTGLGEIELAGEAVESPSADPASGAELAAATTTEARPQSSELPISTKPATNVVAGSMESTYWSLGFVLVLAFLIVLGGTVLVKHRQTGVD